jgi:hypothetical protein
MKTRRLCESKGTFIFHATAETRAKIVERCAIWTRPWGWRWWWRLPHLFSPVPAMDFHHLMQNDVANFFIFFSNPTSFPALSAKIFRKATWHRNPDQINSPNKIIQNEIFFAHQKVKKMLLFIVPLFALATTTTIFIINY